jgi:hypothetical protein
VLCHLEHWVCGYDEGPLVYWAVLEFLTGGSCGKQPGLVVLVPVGVDVWPEAGLSAGVTATVLVVVWCSALCRDSTFCSVLKVLSRALTIQD